MTNKQNKSFLFIFAGAAALALGMGIGRFAYTPILPFMLEEIGLTATEGGLIASWNFIGYFAGSLVALLPLFTIRLKAYFFCSIVVSVATTAAMGLTNELAWFIVIRVLSGMASAFVLIFGTSLILPSIQALGKSSMSTTHLTGVGMGIVLCSVVVSFMAALGSSWSELWFSTSFLALILAIPVFILTPHGIKVQKHFEKYRHNPSKIGFFLVTIAYGLFGFGYVILGTFISTMARTVPEMASTEPYIWLLVGFAGIPTVVFWPWLGSRIGNDLALSLACGIEAVGVYLSAGLNSDVGIILGALILGGTFMGITALAFLEGQKRFPGILLVSTAILTSAFGLGQMLGPYTAGVLIDMTDSFNIVMSASASTLLLAAILVINPKRLGLNW